MKTIKHPSPRILGLLASAAILGAALIFSTPAPAHADVAAPPAGIDHIYFDQTGHTLAAGFLGYWYAHDGSTTLGNPITDEVSLDGLTVQYFERGRLEYHPPAGGKAAVVSESNIGTLVYDTKPIPEQGMLRRNMLAAAAVNTFHITPDLTAYRNARETFRDEGLSPKIIAGLVPPMTATSVYNISDVLHPIWQTNQAVYGAPISDPYSQNVGNVVYTVQDFERARLMYDPATKIATPFNLGYTAASYANISTAATPNNNYWTWSGLNEHWVDVNLSREVLTFMQGPIAIRSSSIVSGKPDDPTPTGTFYINRRVYNEEMKNGKPGDKDYYDLKNVLYTQYFTNQGHALHYAYWWGNNFGFQGSHGCVNEDLSTALFGWNYLTIGSRVYIHM